MAGVKKESLLPRFSVKTALLDNLVCIPVSGAGLYAYPLFGGGTGLYMDFGEWKGVHRVNENPWLEFKVLCLYGKAFQESQGLAGQVLMEAGELNL